MLLDYTRHAFRDFDVLVLMCGHGRKRRHSQLLLRRRGRHRKGRQLLATAAAPLLQVIEGYVDFLIGNTPRGLIDHELIQVF